MKDTSSTAVLSARGSNFLAAFALFSFSCACAEAALVTNTWTSTGNQDWTVAGNWDANGVPVDATSSYAGLNGEIDLIFSGSVMPTTFFDYTTGSGTQSHLDLGGYHQNIINNTPYLTLNSGGTLLVDFVGHSSGFVSDRPGKPHTVLTLGDGIGGGTENVTLDVIGDFQVSRHVGTMVAEINSDGTLDVEQDLSVSYNSTRRGELNVDGGTVIVGRNLRGVQGIYAANTSSEITLDNGASIIVAGYMDHFVDVNPAGTVDVLVDIRDLDSTLIVNYGGDFADLDAVKAQFGSVFVSSTNRTLQAIDNGNGTFTFFAVVPEPSTSLAMLGLIAATALSRRRRKRIG